MKSFTLQQCSFQMLEKTIGIEQTMESPILSAWLEKARNLPISELEHQKVKDLQANLIQNVLGWNEQELALNFIGPLLSFVAFSSKKYNLFAERMLDATIKDVDYRDVYLSGKPDTIIASGFRTPEVPFFAFHEHKPEVDGSGDPIGQVLGAMLIGQAKNNKPEVPIYGCFVIGQNWYFLVLENKSYTVATPFATTSAEIFDVFKVLKTLKAMIEERVG